MLSFLYSVLAQTTSQFHLPIVVKYFREVISGSCILNNYIGSPVVFEPFHVSGPADLLLSVHYGHVLHSTQLKNYLASDVLTQHYFQHEYFHSLLCRNSSLLILCSRTDFLCIKHRKSLHAIYLEPSSRTSIQFSLVNVACDRLVVSQLRDM